MDIRLIDLFEKGPLTTSTAYANKHRGAYNEAMLAYHLNGDKWLDSAHQSSAEASKSELAKLGDTEVTQQEKRAKAMADTFLEHASKQGYSGVKAVHVTSGPGDLERATGMPITQQENPSDVVIHFNKKPTGAAHGFMGLSAKSSTSKKIGFHNGGVGTIGKQIGLDLESVANQEQNKFAKENGLPNSKVERKSLIKKDPALYSRASAAASELHSKLRDTVMEHYSNMAESNHENLRSHLIDTFLKAKNNPESLPYVKVHGQSKGEKDASAYVEEPHNNEIYHSVKNANKLTFAKKGDSYLEVQADGKRAFAIQFKHNSTPMATSLKMNGQH